MVKTTIYLPEELKARVERTAREQGRSEAEVIREALERHTATQPPKPHLGVFSSAEVITDWDEALRGFGGEH